MGRLTPGKLAKVQTSGRSIDKDIDRVVATVGQAARIAGLPVPRKPWLDELATAYDLNHLPQRRDTKLVLGVVDDPVHQSQVPPTSCLRKTPIFVSLGLPVVVSRRRCVVWLWRPRLRRARVRWIFTAWTLPGLL